MKKINEITEKILKNWKGEPFYWTWEEWNEANQTNGEAGEVLKEDEVFIAENELNESEIAELKEFWNEH